MALVRKGALLFTRGKMFSTFAPEKIRNVAIIAHVDHGKTTLVDKLLKATNTVAASKMTDRVMDSGDIERERGITILSKCTSVTYKGHLINLVDTPGHSDFGGEVERILKMVDGVLLVVDVAEGPMAQTKFVLRKSLVKGLQSIVVLNKVDRNEQRVDDAELEEQLEYPVCYASSKEGWAINEMDTIITKISAPKVSLNDPFRFLVSLISYDRHIGRILTGRVDSGKIGPAGPVKSINLGREMLEKGKINKIFSNRGVSRVEIPSAQAGDIVSITGLSKTTVADTVCEECVSEPIEADKVDPPTLEVQISVNTSPLQGKEGTKLTSLQIGERLKEEAKTNVAIAVRNSPDGISYSVKGRGELQLGVLIETMRRENFEMQIGPPKIITKKDDAGNTLEPYENVSIEVDDKFSGVIIEKLAFKKAELKDMKSIESSGKTSLLFYASSRSLLGFDSELKNLSRGSGLMAREFSGYDKYQGKIPSVRKGCVISLNSGTTTNYSLANAESKGKLFVVPNQEVYPGMIIGESSLGKDIEVNPVKAKKMTNIRSAGNDEYIKLQPPVKIPLEAAISYIAEDELIEVTPKAIRIRKKILDSAARLRHHRKTKGKKN